MAKLTPKQARFIEEYLIDLNATQAAIRAGYKETTAYAIGAENLKKPQIAAKIAAEMAARSRRTEITQDRVLTELAKIGFADISDFVAVEGVGGFLQVRVKPTADVPPEKLGAVAAIKNGAYGIEIKLNDKVKALELLGRHLGMFQEKGEGEGPLSVVVRYDYGDGNEAGV